jgi:hypothetical protein
MTYFSKCGKARISDHSDFSPSAPWAVVINGTVICYKGSVYLAYLRCREYGDFVFENLP